MTTKIITAKNAIHIVLARKTKDARFRPYETNFQKWSFFAATALLCSGAIAAAVTYFCKNSYVAFAGLLMLLLSMIAATIYQIVSVLPDLVKLRNIEREISDPLVARFDDDMDLINELSQTYETHHLVYAKESFALMAKQLRERISLLVGALEKVGIIPLVATGYLSFAKAQKDGLVVFTGVEWAFAAFLFLYLFALRFSSTAQWMEQVSLLYEQAVSVKIKRETNP
jgi:hypothetical protein